VCVPASLENTVSFDPHISSSWWNCYFKA